MTTTHTEHTQQRSLHLLGFKCLDLKQTVAVNICVLQDLK